MKPCSRVALRRVATPSSFAQPLNLRQHTTRARACTAKERHFPERTTIPAAGRSTSTLPPPNGNSVLQSHRVNSLQSRSIALPSQSQPRRSYNWTATDIESTGTQASETQKTETQSAEWPASTKSMAAARDFLKRCALSPEPVLLVPDKDGDGLCGATIIRRTLLKLGKPESLLGVRFVAKGGDVHSSEERERMEAALVDGKPPGWFIFVDHGTASDRKLVRDSTENGIERRTLIVDHHVAEGLPEGATILSSYEHAPVVPSSLLSYFLCSELIWPGVSSHGYNKLDQKVKAGSHYAWLAVCGTVADRGEDFPFTESRYPPELVASLRRSRSTKWIKKFVALLNAPKRYESNNPIPAWELLQTATSLDGHELEPNALMMMLKDHAEEVNSAEPTPVKENSQLTKVKRLVVGLDKMRRHVGAVVEYLMLAVLPLRAEDGRLAVVTVESAHLVQPIMATMWSQSNTWKTRAGNGGLCAIVVANTGYEEGKVGYSCRLIKTIALPKSATVEPPDVINMLRQYALRDRNFRDKLQQAESKGQATLIKGHREAASGSMPTALWDMFMERCVKPRDPNAPVTITPVVTKSPKKTNDQHAKAPASWSAIENKYAKEAEDDEL